VPSILKQNGSEGEKRKKKKKPLTKSSKKGKGKQERQGNCYAPQGDQKHVTEMKPPQKKRKKKIWLRGGELATKGKKEKGQKKA